MRALTLLLAAGVLLYLSRLPAVHVLDEVTADYVEDGHTNRVLAGIRVQLRRIGSEARLRVTASAESPNVDPVPGYRGLRGANHTTAQELETTLVSGELKILTRHQGRSAKRFGTCSPGRWGPIPERRVDENGKLALHVPSRRDYLLEVHGLSVALPDGEHDTYLEVKGVPRLRVRARLENGRGKILSVESLGGHDIGQ